MQRYFKLRPSRVLGLLLFFLFSASLVSLWLLPLAKLVIVVLTLVMACSVAVSLLLDTRLRRRSSCVAFRLEDGDGIVLVLRNGLHLPGRVSTDSLVTPYLVILNVVLNEQGGRRSLRILPDAMGADSFRRLRVALRWNVRQDQAAI